MTKGEYQAERRALASLISSLEQFDGSYIGKLGEKSKERIRLAYDNGKPYVMPQHMRSTDGKKIDLSLARDRLQVAEVMIHLADTIESSPALEEYNNAVSLAEEAAKRLIQETGMHDVVHKAQRLGLTRVFLQY